MNSIATIMASIKADAVEAAHVTETPTTPGDAIGRIGDYSIAETVGGSWLLVDESEEGSPVARFTSEIEARRFWRFVTRIAPPAGSGVPSSVVLAVDPSWSTPAIAPPSVPSRDAGGADHG